MKTITINIYLFQLLYFKHEETYRGKKYHPQGERLGKISFHQSYCRKNVDVGVLDIWL